MEVKMDNTYVYNIVAKCIVHFNSLLLLPFLLPFITSPFNSPLFSIIVVLYFLIVA